LSGITFLKVIPYYII